MKVNQIYFEKGSAAPVVLGAAAILAFMTVLGISILPDKSPESDIRMEPVTNIVRLNETFVIDVIVESSVPVNVFAGELHYDHESITISSIDYNTSIADLWAERPWYDNGVGTLTFGGGTTQPGGFRGTDSLIRVTFKALRVGGGSVTLQKPRILLHDGFGTDVKLAESSDSIFFVENDQLLDKDSMDTSDDKVFYEAANEIPSTDLNGDGKQSIVDISIFMLNMAGNNVRYDFNLDGEVDIKDLNILLGAE